MLLSRLRLIAFLPAFLLSACEPTCEATCEKLLSCDEVDTPLVALQDCTGSCLTQEQLYELWEDGQKQTALSEYKTCVQESECSAIAEAVCSDEDIYAW